MDACALYLLESTIDSSVIERFNHRKTQIKFMKDLLLPRLWVLKIFEMKFVITSVWDFSSDFLKIDRFSDGFYRPESGLGSLRLFGHNRNSGLLQNAFRRWPTGVLRFLCCHAEFAYEIHSVAIAFQLHPNPFRRLPTVPIRSEQDFPVLCWKS